MENLTNNLNGGTGAPVGGSGQPLPPGGSDSGKNQPAGAKPDSISINFTPKTPDADTGAADALKISNESKTPTPSNMPQVMSMEIKRDDLKKDAPAPAAEKKGFLSGLFGKKPETQTKPSSAWGGALDVSKDTKKPEATSAKPASGPSMDIAAPTTASTPTLAATPTPTVKPAIGATPTPAPAPKPGEKPDFFSSAALQEKAGTSKLMENIVSQKAQLEQPKMEDLLGKKSTILEKTIELESQLKLKNKMRLMQFMAFMVAVVAIAVNGYLYYQLSPGVDILGYARYDFDSNLRNDVFNLNQSLKSIQTELNKYQYLSGQLYLDQFGYESTRFIDGINNLETPGSAEDKNTIASIVTEAKNNMPDLLAGAKQNLSSPISVETYTTRGEEQIDPTLTDSEFQRMLKQSISDEKKNFVQNNTQGDLELPKGTLSFFDNASTLVGNGKLLANLKARTVDAFKLDADDYEKNTDPVQRATFRGYIDNLLSSTKINLATITNLRNSRIAWTDVINRIEQISNKINTEHNSGGSVYNASSISYSNFDLNSNTNKIIVTGVSVTQSGTNREVITYLLEAFEASPEFKNASNRTFPLSKSIDLSGQEVYTLNFKIDMELETGAFSKLNEPVADLQTEKVAVVKIPVKHNN